eukprot:scaffold978_cov392-Prasinococcus_capsulatus_cf.AAC.23
MDLGCVNCTEPRPLHVTTTTTEPDAAQGTRSATLSHYSPSGVLSSQNTGIPVPWPAPVPAGRATGRPPAGARQGRTWGDPASQLLQRHSGARRLAAGCRWPARSVLAEPRRARAQVSQGGLPAPSAPQGWAALQYKAGRERAHGR